MRIPRIPTRRYARRTMNSPFALRTLSRFICQAAAVAALSLGVLPVGAQQNWRWANSLPASTFWSDVAYGAGLYVVSIQGGGLKITMKVILLK